jgi:hypothetical protein
MRRIITSILNHYKSLRIKQTKGGMLNICVTLWLGGFRLFMDLEFILYYSHVYKEVSSLLYKTALINHVYHTMLHYSTGILLRRSSGT